MFSFPCGLGTEGGDSAAARPVTADTSATNRTRSSLTLYAGDHADVLGPRKRGLAPDAPLGWQRRLLRQATHSERVTWRIVRVRTCRHRRSTIRSERMSAPRAAIGSLDVDLGSATKEAEAWRRRGDRNPECGAGKHLAIRAVADAHARWVDLCLVGDLPTVTCAGDFHVYLRAPGQSSRPSLRSSE